MSSQSTSISSNLSLSKRMTSSCITTISPLTHSLVSSRAQSQPAFADSGGAHSSSSAFAAIDRNTTNINATRGGVVLQIRERDERRSFPNAAIILAIRRARDRAAHVVRRPASSTPIFRSDPRQCGFHSSPRRNAGVPAVRCSRALRPGCQAPFPGENRAMAADP